VWETVEIKAEEVRMAKVEGERKERRSRKKKRREQNEEEKETKRDRSIKDSKRVEDLG